MSLLKVLRRRRDRRPGPSLHWLTDDLALSAQPRPEDWPSIRAAGIRCVFDLRAETEDSRELVEGRGLRYFRLPIAEWAAPSDSNLRLWAERVVEAIRGTGPVLVHCREGRGRSALIACAVLVTLGMPAAEAYRLVLRARPNMSLSDEQARALERLIQPRPNPEGPSGT